MTLGEFIKSYRVQHHLSQRQFADQAGVSNGYISMLEKNENPQTKSPLTPSMPVMKKIAAAMGMTINDMCTYVEDMAIDLGTTIIDYEEAQNTLRIILSEKEYTLLRAFQAADTRAQDDAILLLRAHQPVD